MTKVFLVGKIKLTFVLVNNGLLSKINFLRRIEEMKKFSLVAILLLLVVFMGCTPTEYFAYNTKYDYVYGYSIEITGLSKVNLKQNLKTIVIPKKIDGLSVTSIANDAFRGYTNLTSVTIPDSVTKIGRSAFSNCTSLTSITIPDSVTVIGSYAFSGCKNLTNVSIPNRVEAIYVGTFESCSLSNITIPNSVTAIGAEAFKNCFFLRNVTIPDTVTDIYTRAFSGCTSLTNVTIPDSVKHIASDAFEGTGVKLPERFN